MKPNRASRFNRAMMIGMMFMGIVVIGCVFFFLYWAGNTQKDKQEQEQRLTSGDSITLQLDSSLIDSVQ